MSGKKGTEAEASAQDPVKTKQAETPKSGTALRFASALPLVAVAVYLTFWGDPLYFKLFGLVWVGIVANELMVMTIPESRACQAWGTLSTAGFSALMFWGGTGGLLIAGLFGVVVGALIFSLSAPKPVERAAQRIGWLLGAPLYVGVTLGTAGLLHGKPLGSYWMLLAFFCAFLSDTGAYFAGRAFGKHKLYPLVSPKKTVEGAIGGLVTVALSAAALHYFALSMIPLWHLVLLAVVAGALGQAGDLLESLIKRSCGVKDSGTIMPGHGGLLDRSDALMFTSATVWLYANFFV